MPCFHDLNSDRFTPISSAERAIIEAIVARAPDVLAPILTQLDNARTRDDGNGWLVLRDARGLPCQWPEGEPFDVPPPSQTLGPQGCYSITLWFHDDGQLQAVEFLMLQKNSPLELDGLTSWLTI
jgi:hypothetical protein